MVPINNVHVKETVRLITAAGAQSGVAGERGIDGIAWCRAGRRSPRYSSNAIPGMLLVVGPCSIHDVNGALEYANRLNTLRKELGDQFYILSCGFISRNRAQPSAGRG